jgi:hypothetical protein
VLKTSSPKDGDADVRDEKVFDMDGDNLPADVKKGVAEFYAYIRLEFEALLVEFGDLVVIAKGEHALYKEVAGYVFPDENSGIVKISADASVSVLLGL